MNRKQRNAIRNPEEVECINSVKTGTCNYNCGYMQHLRYTVETVLRLAHLVHPQLKLCDADLSL